MDYQCVHDIRKFEPYKAIDRSIGKRPAADFYTARVDTPCEKDSFVSVIGGI